MIAVVLLASLCFFLSALRSLCEELCLICAQLKDVTVRPQMIRPGLQMQLRLTSWHFGTCYKIQVVVCEGEGKLFVDAVRFIDMYWKRGAVRFNL